VLHALDRERGGISRSPQRHRFENIQALGHRYHPAGGNAGVIGITAVVRHADIVAGRDHGIAFPEARIGGFHHSSGQVDAAHAGEAADDLAGAAGSERVLEIDARVRDLDDDVAGIELIQPHVREAAGDFAVIVEYPVGLQGRHSFLLDHVRT
jgi:hypothetical protein